LLSISDAAPGNLISSSMSEASLSEKANALRAKSGKDPRAEEIVTTLCEFIQSESAPDKNGNMVTSQVRHCPKGTFCSLNANGEMGLIKFRKQAGFTNPLNHIKKFCFSNDNSLLLDAYWEAKVGAKIQSNLEEFFELPIKSQGASIIRKKKDNELFDWVEMIVMKNWAACCVENDMYRSKMKHEYRFSIKSVRAVIIAMTCFVEEKLAAEMKAAGKGSIVHDAWTKFGTHFFALFSTYMASRQFLVEGSMLTVYKPVISLLSVSPLHTIARESEDEDDSEDLEDMEEATSFTAQVHKQHIIDILVNYYGIDIAKWITNQTADSASVNILLAKLLGIPHENCENHLLNNEVKLWLTNSTIEENGENARSFGPGTVVKYIHKTMLDLKTNKSRAVLHSKTELAPTIGNETRWSRSHSMMTKWGKIEDTCNAASQDNATFVMPPSTLPFRCAARNTTQMLEDINFVTVKLQERALPLHKCWDLQDLLIDAVQTGRADKNSHWSSNTFGTVYIDPESDKQPNKAFVNATIKMQKRVGHTLLTSERSAISKWLKKAPTDDKGRTMSLADCLKDSEPRGEKRSAEQMHGHDNHADSCLDHVIGSAAEVERLWSEARYIMTTSRSAMAPIFFRQFYFFVTTATFGMRKLCRKQC
jgi:hypothetical protein